MILTSPINTTIHFTIDGNNPDENSPVYSTPIILDSTKPVRAVVIPNQNDILPSNIITNSYIINYSGKLPVVSISTNPDYFWDWDTGIYVSGPNASPFYPYFGANFWQDWEIPASIEYFDIDKDR